VAEQTRSHGFHGPSLLFRARISTCQLAKRQPVPTYPARANIMTLPGAISSGTAQSGLCTPPLVRGPAPPPRGRGAGRPSRWESEGRQPRRLHSRRFEGISACRDLAA
jgi:hypothetical protein